MSKKIKIFLSIDYEIYDFIDLIEQLLLKKNKVIVSYSGKSKKNDFKARDVGLIYNRLSANKNFLFFHHEINRNPLTETFRKLNTFFEYLSRDKNDFSKLKLRIVETSSILQFLDKFPKLFDNKFCSKFVKSINLFLESLTFSKKLIKFLIIIRPDIVVFNQLLRQITVNQNEIVKACDYLKIPSCYIVKSWDNLTNKSFMNLHPDHIFVWNIFQEEELIKFHHVSNSKIHVVGASLYEHLLAPIKIRDKDQYCNDLGLDNKKKTVTYFGSSPQIIKNDFEYFSFILKKLEKTNFFDNFNLIYRSHPLNNNFRKSKLSFNSSQFVAYPTPRNFDKIILDKKKYLETIINSDFILGVNTSAIVESAFYLKPLILLNIKENDEDHGLFLETYHSKYLTADNSGVGIVVNDENELLEALNKTGENKKISSKIKKFKNVFINLFAKSKPTNNIARIFDSGLEKRFKSFNFLPPNEIFTIKITKVKKVYKIFKLLYELKNIFSKSKKKRVMVFHRLSKIPRRLKDKIKKITSSKVKKKTVLERLLAKTRKLKKRRVMVCHRLSKMPRRLKAKIKKIIRIIFVFPS